MKKILNIFLLMLLGTIPGALAQDADTRFDVVVEKVADDIYVFHRNPSWRSPVQANVTAIINQNDVVVVDSGYPQYTENIVREISKLTDNPISTVITTHWHQDHNWGDFVYRRAYPDVKIIAHENTRKTLITRNDKEGLDDPESRQNFKDALEQRAEELKDQPRLANYTLDRLAGVDLIFDQIAQSRDSHADMTFKDRLVLHRPDRTIEILYLGRANTNGDAVVWLSEERVVVTGDIVVRPTPYGFGSYPREWVKTLQKIIDLDYKVLIPGHGDLQRDTAYLETLMALLESLSDQTAAAVENGASSVDEVREQVDFSEFDQKIAGDDPLLQRLFQVWFKNPILESAYREAIGEEISQTNE